jgi:hypothetical protein
MAAGVVSSGAVFGDGDPVDVFMGADADAESIRLILECLEIYRCTGMLRWDIVPHTNGKVFKRPSLMLRSIT